ncbi:hypothetical protein EON66_04235 [archaeon]|nr:MAG: hypothetical protein EON66_04235 [archaeon]
MTTCLTMWRRAPLRGFHAGLCCRQVPSAPGSTVRSTAHATSAGENLLTSADATPSGSARSSSRRRGLDAGAHS